MAYIQYDFYHPWDKEKLFRVIGTRKTSSKEVAEKIAEILNQSHGEGTHWVIEDEEV